MATPHQLAHYTTLANQAEALKTKPAQPQYVAGWLAKLDQHSLLTEAQALARELALLKGIGHRPQSGCSIVTKPLGESECLVEFEFTPGDPGRYSGPPEDCYPSESAEVTILQVFINGLWCDPSDFLADSILERWQEEIEQECSDAAEDDRDDCDDSRDDYLADRAADRYQADIDARHAA